MNKNLKTDRKQLIDVVTKFISLLVVSSNDYDKYFTKARLKAGVCMGSGYAIVDGFYKIYDEFISDISDDLYRDIQRKLDEMENEERRKINDLDKNAR